MWRARAGPRMRLIFLVSVAALLGCAPSKSSDAAPGEEGNDASIAPPTPNDAGAQNVAPPDAGGDGGAQPIDSGTSSACATSGVAFCDGFEADAVDPAVWTIDGMAPAIDPAFAARGTHSLHLLIQPTSSVHRSRISETKTFPAPQNSLYGRVFVYVANATPSFHMGIVWGAQEKGTEAVYAIGTGRSNLLVNYKDPTIDNGVNDGKTFPVNRWVCLEWQFDGVSNVVNIWLDGVADPGATLTGYTAPRFDHLFLGMALYNGTTTLTSPYEMWLDELALDDQRVTCEK